MEPPPSDPEQWTRLRRAEEALAGERWALREARMALAAASDEATRRRAYAVVAAREATVLGLLSEVAVLKAAQAGG